MNHGREDYNQRIQDTANLIPENEPVFLLRGQDIFAPELVRRYAALVRGERLEDSADRIEAHAAVMDAWRGKKLPDVPESIEPLSAPEEGNLLVGAVDGNVVVSHPKLQTDASGCGFLVFSPKQARDFALLMLKNADTAAGIKEEDGFEYLLAAAKDELKEEARVVLECNSIKDDPETLEPEVREGYESLLGLVKGLSALIGDDGVPDAPESGAKVYQGKFGDPCDVTVDGVMLELEPSLGLFRHSPDGFGWGYNGSGPAQLALAILFDYYSARHPEDAAEIALRLHQGFKANVVANWPIEGDWQITGAEVEAATGVPR